MSPTDAGRFTAATFSHPTGHPIAPTPGGGHTSVPGGVASTGVLATRPQTPRGAIIAARVNPSHRSDPHRYNDPSNYLG
jgi:hypothetical protein